MDPQPGCEVTRRRCTFDPKSKRRAFLRNLKRGDKVEIVTEVEVLTRLISGLVLKSRRERQYVGAIYQEPGANGGHVVWVDTTGMWVKTKDLHEHLGDD